MLTDLPAGTWHSPFLRVFHTLTKHECYPPLMCNKFERTHSKEQVMGIAAQMYITVELMVRLRNNWQGEKTTLIKYYNNAIQTSTNLYFSTLSIFVPLYLLIKWISLIYTIVITICIFLFPIGTKLFYSVLLKLSHSLKLLLSNRES